MTSRCRVQILGLSIVIAVAAIAILLGTLPERNDPKRDAVSHYLAYRQQRTGQSTHVAHEAKARDPHALDESTGAVTFGSDIYYRTDHALGAVHTTAPAGASDQAVLFRPDAPDAPRPLPYPPREVWCVWLEQAGAADAEQQIVLVARHQDLYNAEWIVHEPTASSEAASHQMQAVGCGVHD